MVLGPKSEKNIIAALANESLSRNKYSFFAEKARDEGYDEIAVMFDRMANNEKEHSKIWYNILYSVSSTAENLKEAARQENYEWKNMYPDFARDAREEGNEMLAIMFERIAAIENRHEREFLEASLKIGTMKVHIKTEDELAASRKIPEIEAMEFDKTAVDNVGSYRCMYCGQTATDSFDICPTCDGIGAFERIYVS